MTKKISLKPFINSLNRENIDDSETYHLSMASAKNIKLAKNKLSKVLKSFDEKGFLLSDERKILREAIEHIQNVDHQDRKSNGD